MDTLYKKRQCYSIKKCSHKSNSSDFPQLIEQIQKVDSGLLDEERANTMKEEISHKVDILIQMWSEAGEKRLKEKLAELCSPEAEPVDLVDNPEVEPIHSPTNPSKA